MAKKSSKRQNIYCIGVKGVGMTMLAQFLASKGNRISGSDVADVFLTDRVLRKARIKVFSPFAAKNIPDKIDAIIYSTSQDLENNPEIAFIKNNPARFKGISFLSYAEALGRVFNQYRGIAVCGSHGKTTTSAWLGYVLSKAGKKPNVLVGSRVPQFNGSGLSGPSKDFIAEVDEYQNKLQYFQPHGVVLNNIDYDHPDFFKTPAAYTKVFADFVKKIPARGFLVVNKRDPESQKIKRYCRGKVINYDLVSGSYGAGVDYLAYDVKPTGIFQSFSLSYQGEALGRFKICLWGEHNILNALAVIAAAREMKVAWPLIRKHLTGFRGTDRRAQILGKYKGALVVDDYAHHPTEIRSTLAGLRRHYPGKNIITVFHPHTFTRTKAFFKDFAASFADTDELVVLDIYGSAREKRGDVSSPELVAAIKKYNQAVRIKQPVRAIATISEATRYLKAKLKARDILVLMGAGDVFRIADGLLKADRRK
jgi:UDP-N-acetylmuramate--alanine ligase